ncbi:hypothetical protein BDP27DRAFT_1331544 [Rhodocollybia butyracea]|uniref:Uncharacterized protein n=1 Tax=Rhodocollybia butyracea TaxID=206335 RepID=A0A9P5PNL6_9AGAR|nr:hypothetical protein BDP27DRAFT_1331544 [Rhodocollybia butyracea]
MLGHDHPTLNMKSDRYPRELLVLDGEESCVDVAKVALRRHSSFKTRAYGRQVTTIWLSESALPVS